MSLGLETSRDPFLQVLVLVLVLDKQVLNPSLADAHLYSSIRHHGRRRKFSDTGSSAVTSSGHSQAIRKSILNTKYRVIIITSLPKVIWEEGRVAALSHTHAVKSPLVTMARHKVSPKSIRGRIPKPRYLPHAWNRSTYDAKWHPDPIRRFSTKHWTDRQIVHEKFDDYGAAVLQERRGVIIVIHVVIIIIIMRNGTKLYRFACKRGSGTVKIPPRMHQNSPY